MGFISDFGIGGLVSNLSEAFGSGKARKDRDDERARAAQDRNILVERARIGPDMMARVEAVKAAGFHPSFALSGGGFGMSGSSPVISSSSGAPATPQFDFRSDRAERVVDPNIERYNAARADLAEVEVQLARRRLVEQPGNARASDVVVNAYRDPGEGMTMSDLEGHPYYRNAVKLKPDEMTSRDVSNVGQTAGRDHPGMRQFVLPGGFRMLMPDTGSGGMPEDIEVALLPAVIGANVERYGSRWIGDYLRYMMGTSPGEPGWLGSAMDALGRIAAEGRDFSNRRFGERR